MGIEPKERSLQTRLLIHVHYKQMVLKRTPADSVALLRSLDWFAPHSLSQTKAQIKTSMAGATSLKRREEAEGSMR